ncbi:probable hydrolase PNKD [Bufo bufo]|uniref:probable hydrolase PNKD n=1 Tax=Bufo bufo TaxID=8384 RepID=UPI001ABE2429|nr:probable hydrolase PNKD [Bufo bufo]
MAASRAAVLLSGGVRSCKDSLLGAVCRRTLFPRPSIAEIAKSVHSASPLCAAPKNEEPVHRSSMYVAGAKGQNPMKKVGIAWVIGLPSGILLFLFAKNKVDKRRLEQMKALQRMRDANKGEYMSERFTKSV